MKDRTRTFSISSAMLPGDPSLPAYKRPWETELRMMTRLKMMTMTLKQAGCHAKAKLPRAKSSEKSFRRAEMVRS